MASGLTAVRRARYRGRRPVKPDVVVVGPSGVVGASAGDATTGPPNLLVRFRPARTGLNLTRSGDRGTRAAYARLIVATPQALNPWLESRLPVLAGEGVVLDLGCGRGFWLERMRAAGLHPVGIDEDPPRVADAARRAPVMAADGAAIPLASGSVRLVWCIHVLHHLVDPGQVLSEVRRVLEPGGSLVLAETVEDNPVVRTGRRLWPNWDGVPIRSRFRAATLLDLVADAGLEVVEHRQHSLVSFAAWLLPRAPERAWVVLSGLEERLPASTARFGAHVELVARAT